MYIFYGKTCLRHIKSVTFFGCFAKALGRSKQNLGSPKEKCICRKNLNFVSDLEHVLFMDKALYKSIVMIYYYYYMYMQVLTLNPCGWTMKKLKRGRNLLSTKPSLTVAPASRWASLSTPPDPPVSLGRHPDHQVSRQRRRWHFMLTPQILQWKMVRFKRSCRVFFFDGSPTLGHSANFYILPPLFIQWAFSPHMKCFDIFKICSFALCEMFGSKMSC